MGFTRAIASQFLPVLGLLLSLAAFLQSQTGVTAPVRYEAEYTKIFSDDIEAATPTLSPGFRLEAGGSLTSNPRTGFYVNSSATSGYA